MNIVLIGEEAAGMRTLQLLEQCGVRIVAVMASPGRQDGGVSLWDQATRRGYATWPAGLVKDPTFAAQVRDARVDVIVNAHSLVLIRKEVLEAPRLGSFNLHPGPLPRYAGLNSVCWAIYRGEKEHGVTLHRLVPEVDAGPIVYQEAVGIGAEETGLSLTVKCVNIGIPLISRLLDAAAQGPSHIPSVPQDLSRREYYGGEMPDNGSLSWNRPARRVVDLVRASNFFPFRSPWGIPRTRRGDTTLGILKAQMTGTPADAPAGTVGAERSGGVEVACADEWILVRQVVRDGMCIPARDALKAGDRLAEGVNT